MTFLLAATMAIAVVQLEVTSSVGATQFQPDDSSLREPLNDVNRSNKSSRLAWQRSTERDVTYIVYDAGKSTATRITLEKPQPVVAPAATELAWDSSADIRDTCEPLVSPMIAEELKIAPRRCPT
jgi:hypothetical protein